MDAKAILTKVAASLLTQRMSGDIEEWQFSNSTPKKDKRKLINAVDKQNDFQRRMAIEIKKAIDLL